MFDSIARIFGQMGDPRLRGALVGSILATLVLIVGLAVGAGLAIDALSATGIAWLDGTLAVLGAVGAFVLAVLFFPGSVQIISGFFLDRVADAVEARHYPDLGDTRRQPMMEILLGALRFAGISIGLNLLCLPLYLVPGVNLVLFYLLNGYLLGREYAELVGARRLSDAGLREFRRRNRFALFVGGVLIAILSTIPVLNLAMPILATGFALHEHERLRRRGIPG